MYEQFSLQSIFVSCIEAKLMRACADLEECLNKRAIHEVGNVAITLFSHPRHVLLYIKLFRLDLF